MSCAPLSSPPLSSAALSSAALSSAALSICSDGSMDLTDTESSIQQLQQSLESIYATLSNVIALQKKVEKKVLAIKPVYTFFTTPRRAVTDRYASNSSHKDSLLPASAGSSDRVGTASSYSDRLEEVLADPATTLSVGGSAVNGIDCYTYFQKVIAPSTPTPFYSS
jgi:hypothetical protein